MDVNPASGTVHPGPYVRDALAPPQGAERAARRAEQETAATAAPERVHDWEIHPAHADKADLSPAEAAAKEEPAGTEKPPPKGSAEASSLLKFDVSSSDVLARFQIDQDTNRVIVSMYQRDTGELIKEYPPRQVLDVLAALAGRGLAVDVQG